MKALTIAIALLGALTIARADLRSDIESANRTITNAMKHKDFATLERVMKAGMTADFKYTEDGKTQTFSEMFENMKMGLGMMNKITVCTTKTLTLKQHGNSAINTTRHTMAGTTKGPDNKVHTMSFTGVAEHGYVKQGGKWKMATMTWKTTKTLMDGKPVAMGG